MVQLQQAADARAAAQSRVRLELLTELVRKDLKVKYKNSALGFIWSLANPLLYLAVFTLVFTFFLDNGVPEFAVLFMSGFLVWNFFNSATLDATGAVVGNANLVRKVRFPRVVLPLASVGFAGVHFVLQLLVFFVFLLSGSTRTPSGPSCCCWSRRWPSLWSSPRPCRCSRRP